MLVYVLRVQVHLYYDFLVSGLVTKLTTVHIAPEEGRDKTQKQHSLIGSQLIF
jgi:hypothetical protein